MTVVIRRLLLRLPRIVSESPRLELGRYSSVQNDGRFLPIGDLTCRSTTALSYFVEVFTLSARTLHELQRVNLGLSSNNPSTSHRYVKYSRPTYFCQAF